MTPHGCPGPNPWPHGSARASEEERSTAWRTDGLRKPILHRPVTNTHINVLLARNEEHATGSSRRGNPLCSGRIAAELCPTVMW